MSVRSRDHLVEIRGLLKSQSVEFTVEDVHAFRVKPLSQSLLFDEYDVTSVK